MEKAFALKSAEFSFRNGGKVATYLTLDERVMLVCLIKKVDWSNREETEVFRCAKCNHFIFPKGIKKGRQLIFPREQMVVKEGKKLHKFPCGESSVQAIAETEQSPIEEATKRRSDQEVAGSQSDQGGE